jgi:hypothetical protein
MTRRTIPYGMEAMTKPLMRAWVANDRAGGGADGGQSGGSLADGRRNVGEFVVQARPRGTVIPPRPP